MRVRYLRDGTERGREMTTVPSRGAETRTVRGQSMTSPLLPSVGQNETGVVR
jgi:hypothetical protein